MRPLLHPFLVNGRFGDPALFVETLFETRAVLFDLGDITVLPPRKLLRIDRVFVSHTHLDHFFGFDRLLRMLVGREKVVSLYGPEGFIDQVSHKLRAYQWNLVDRYLDDLRFIVSEVVGSQGVRTACLRLKNAFVREELGESPLEDGLLHSEPRFLVRTAVLEHRVPCLGFAIEETAHINIWKTRLDELGLPVGPWLRELKQAIVENRPDGTPIAIRARPSTSPTREMPLGALRKVLTVTPGQKIGYVTDVANTPANRDAIIRLVKGADVLFIEAAFSTADAALAADRAHLTTAAAGAIAREAGVRCVEAFHFSPRYAGREAEMLAEVSVAFGGERAST